MLKHFKKFRESQGIEEVDEDFYMGNMWGWKVSYIGLGLMVFLLALYFYRITYHPQALENDLVPEKRELPVKD